MADKFINLTGLSSLKSWILGKLAGKQATLESGVNIKTVNGQSLLGDGNIETPTGTVDQHYNAYSTNAQSGTAVAEAIDDMASYSADTSSPQYNGVVSHGNDSLAFTLDENTVGVTMASPSVYYSEKLLPTKGYVDGKTGDLSALTTTEQTNLVSAINEIDFAVKGLGEPFRLQDFTQQINVTIPSITTEVANTAIPNVDVDLNVIDPTGALNESFAIAGLVKYEVYDATSGGNRLNVTPICSFSMNSQRVLRIRMMCAGPSSKTARRIAGALLLKHR